MSWIKTVAYEDAKGKLKTLYDRVKGPDNNVDNIMMAHSLRPHSMEGHMHIYKYVLHHSANTIPKHFLETLGVWVSLLNKCGYCVEHHFQGLRRLLSDDDRANAIRQAFEADELSPTFSDKESAAINYARALTLSPSELTSESVEALRQAGWDDGEILEINQVSAYFCYANRTVLGLGVSIDGDILGLSPGDNADPDNWSHG